MDSFPPSTRRSGERWYMSSLLPRGFGRHPWPLRAAVACALAASCAAGAQPLGSSPVDNKTPANDADIRPGERLSAWLLRQPAETAAPGLAWRIPLERLAQQMVSHMGLEALVVTRGREGMMVFKRSGVPQSLAIFGSDQALDVTGAGDTVIAVLTLAMAAGATVLEAAQLANYAGGIVVMKRGTATVTRAELAAAIRTEATGLPAAGDA